jgi:hypothetical protein
MSGSDTIKPLIVSLLPTTKGMFWMPWVSPGFLLV